MSAMLDHTVFPHILDAVVSFADHGTRVVLRRTSRGVRNVIDVEMYAHVVLTSTWSGPGMGPWLDDGPGKLLSSLAKVTAGSRQAVSGPGLRLPWSPQHSTLERLAVGWGGRTACTRVLDVYGWWSDSDSYAAQEAFKHVDVLRRSSRGIARPANDIRTVDGNTLTLHAKTIVDAIVLCEGPECSSGYAYGQSLPLRPVFPDGPFVPRLVLHVIFDPAYDDLHREDVLFECNASEVVFLFTVNAAAGEVCCHPECANVNVEDEVMGDDDDEVDDEEMYNADNDDDDDDAYIPDETEEDYDSDMDYYLEYTDDMDGDSDTASVAQVFDPQSSVFRYFLCAPCDPAYRAKRWTFVGLLQADWRVVGLCDQSRLDPEETLRDTMRDVGETTYGLTPNEVSRRLDNVRFVSREEYAAEVGAAQWQLESTWYG